MDVVMEAEKWIELAIQARKSKLNSEDHCSFFQDHLKDVKYLDMSIYRLFEKII